MQNQGHTIGTPLVSFKTVVLRFFIAVIFSIALGYFEASVVVYLREIFYPEGFTFPLELFTIDPLFKRLCFTEIGREAASLILILTAACLFGSNRRQKVAYFLIIFSIWDIFYYIWLKVLLDWPAAIMDWDILFLIPMTWASPVLAPVLCSIMMLVFAIVVLYRDYRGKSIVTSYLDMSGYLISGIIIIVSFCIPGPHTAQDDYFKYFSWPLFSIGLIIPIGIFIKCLLKKNRPL